MAILFTSDNPGLYLIEHIYDSVTNPSGTIIPRPGSLVLDRGNNNLLLTVKSVNEVTLNTTYEPVLTSLLSPETSPTSPADDSITSIIDYGNTRFYLFYDKAENPTKLNPDKEIIILGDDAVSFEISRFDVTLQQYVPISLYYDTGGVYRGTKVPLIPIADASNAKIPTNCHTNWDMGEDDVYLLAIYDYAGTQCGSFKLFSKKALINNTLEDALIIEDMMIEATQIDDEGLYLFPDQDPSSLVITPRLIYNNGTSRVLSIDNTVCYLYGLDGFTAAYPGQSVELLVKYFLAPTQQASGDALVVTEDTHYLMKQVTLTVKDPGTNEYSFKILVVPKYIVSTSTWTLLFFMYTVGDTVVRNITPNVTVSAGFNGQTMGADQAVILSLRIRDIFPDAASDFIYQQPLAIRLAPYNYYERYILRDTMGDLYGIYGVDSPILARPVLYYDASIEKYFIPTSKFSNTNTLLEAFYYKLRPPYNSDWLTAPPNPSHFTIRDAVNGMLLLSAPISLEGYQQSFSLTNVTSPDQLLGINCIVEFLLYEQDQYTSLWGAPVDVYAGIYA